MTGARDKPLLHVHVHSCRKHHDEEVASSSSKKKTNSRLECKNLMTLFITKMAKINTLFMTKAAEKPYSLGPHMPI